MTLLDLVVSLLRRALGDIGNLVGGFNQKVHVGKDGKVVPDAKDGAQVKTLVLLISEFYFKELYRTEI